MRKGNSDEQVRVFVGVDDTEVMEIIRLASIKAVIVTVLGIGERVGR